MFHIFDIELDTEYTALGGPLPRAAKSALFNYCQHLTISVRNYFGKTELDLHLDKQDA